MAGNLHKPEAGASAPLGLSSMDGSTVDGSL